MRGFPCGSVSKESAYNAGNPGLIPGLGRSPGEGNGNPLQYSCLEKLMDCSLSGSSVHRIARVRHDLAAKLPPPPPRPEETKECGIHRRREFCPQTAALGREDHCSPPLPTQGSTGGAHWPLGNTTAWDLSFSGLPHPALCSPHRRRLGHPGLIL